MSADEIIRLNVGSRFLTTKRTTLTKYKDSMLERMFIGEIQLNLDLAEVVDSKNVSLDHLTAAASYFGLKDMHYSCRV